MKDCTGPKAHAVLVTHACLIEEELRNNGRVKQPQEQSSQVKFKLRVRKGITRCEING